MGVVIFILILALLIIVHEFGHFLAAKKSGVLVEEFGIGFPPRLFKLKKGETIYSLNLIPLGGFVKLYGEEYHEHANKDSKLKKRAFVHKKSWQKTAIITAGIFGNFILGWIIISFLFTQGVPTPTNKVVIEKVQRNSPAEIAGLQTKDQVLKVTASNKTYPITKTEEIIRLSRQFAGEKITIEIKRGGVEKQISLIPRIKSTKGQGPLGVVITTPFVEKKYTWFEAPFYGLAFAFETTIKIVQSLTRVLIQFLSFQKTDADIRGPIGIAQITGETIKFGKNAVLELIALLSLNLAVINILPFPALDGGRLTFVLYEWFTKRRVNKHVEKYANLFGIVILLSLAFIISINDILRLLK